MLLYKATAKESLKERNAMFVKHGIKILNEKGFVKSPFVSSWYGRNNLGDYSYELCRVTNNSTLEILFASIVEDDDWIKMFLNIFILTPMVKHVSELDGVDGFQFHLPPNSTTSMRLRIDNTGIMPIINIFGKKHKIGLYFTSKEFHERVEELGKVIKTDLSNIEDFAQLWYRYNIPLIVDWDGHITHS